MCCCGMTILLLWENWKAKMDRQEPQATKSDAEDRTLRLALVLQTGLALHGLRMQG
jgi:hypothetical protein